MKNAKANLKNMTKRDVNPVTKKVAKPKEIPMKETLEHKLFKLNISVHDIAEYTEYSLGWVKACLRGKPSKPFLKAINEFIKLKEAGLTTEIKNLKEYRKRNEVLDLMDPNGYRQDIAREFSNFSVEGQNLEDEFKFFVQEEEAPEDKKKREKYQKDFRLAYEKEAGISTEEMLKDIKPEDMEELKVLMAEQHMDDQNCLKTSSGKAKAPIKVSIQKFYSFEAEQKDEHDLPILDENGDPKTELVEGWMNLTARDLGLGDTHKGVDPETGKEFRIPYKWEVPLDGGFERVALFEGEGDKRKPMLDKDGAQVYSLKPTGDIIFRKDDGSYDINTDMLMENLDCTLVYRAGRYTDLVVINGEEYRLKVQHSLLGEVVGLDYTDDIGHSLVGLDGYANAEDHWNSCQERLNQVRVHNMVASATCSDEDFENWSPMEYKEPEFVSAPIVLVQPKEQYSKDVNKYQYNLEESQREIMVGRSAEVILSTTQLFYSEWQERCRQMREEKEANAIGFRAKVSVSAAKTRAMSSPYYTVVLELNKLFKQKKYKEMAALAKKHKDNADDILTYARANKKFANLEFDKSSTFPSPYIAVRKYATPVKKKVERKADLIEANVAELVRELKKTKDKSLITADNAKDIIKAARAGGEFRMDGEFKELYLHARDISKKPAEAKEEAPVVMGAKERAEARKAARKAA